MHSKNRFADFLSRAVLFLLIVASGVAVFAWYLPMISRNQSLREEILREDASIADLRHQLRKLEDQVNHFQTNDVLLERIAREQFSYARSSEVLFYLVQEEP